MEKLWTAPDGKPRCAWCGAAPDDAEYLRYHDEEWGFPVADDRRLFEKLCLEGFQAGLSWRTILNKRPAFRAAFREFDFRQVARFGERDVERLLQDAGIVRHRGKIEAVIGNARACVELIEAEGSLARFVWRFAPAERTPGATETAASKALSKELKKRGWRFVGPTTMHAFMQSVGLVNDHADACETHAAAVRARKAFKVPN
ncbi:MAG: DNA-3-methyladenine glycosylase I [Pelomonas sp.]|nr:DNA-3-methyladenine glycosylase I [Roseateles sp.]MBV8604646.1 DNA-3-methyladenine glycosylase I [Roseateles sp.]